MKTEQYDVAIIGAGISGLVCGCYLAKAGIKTVLIEKNKHVGGYCTSFTRDGYHFEACAHGLGSFRDGGRLNMLFKDLDLYKRITIKRKDPSDIIFTPSHKVYIFNSIDKTIKEFQRNFPLEKSQIEKFIKYVTYGELSEFMKHRSKTLKILLDDYFKDEELKTIFSVFILGFVGCPPHKISCVVACLVFREFIFDGGYLPLGGIQEFPDALLKRYLELGGEIRLNTIAKKIIFENKKIKGIVLNNKNTIFANRIVSACDSRQTFLGLIGENKLSARMIDKVKKAEPSMSSFLVYLGMKKNYNISPEQNANIWIITNPNIEFVYSNMMQCNNDCLFLTTSEKLIDGVKNISVRLESNVSSMDNEFWTKEKCDQIAEKFIKLSEIILPDLSKNILLKFSASPRTLNKWTNNYSGASYGWASIPSQFGDPDFSQKTEVDNLYITGHWSNQSSGIAVVVNCGYEAAKLILNKKNI